MLMTLLRERARRSGGQLLRDKWSVAACCTVPPGGIQARRKAWTIYSEKPDTKIKEHGIWYSVDLTMNRDASLYLDTRNLRKWLIENMHGKTVLNTFAYTGSLGVAARAGGARRVVQHDLNRQFLNIAKTSYALNGFPIQKQDFVRADFFTLVSKLKRADETFDCVLIDPPFFRLPQR
jgi:23S rRNA (cytosine1962-C5)-methyltransferase